MLAQEQQEGLSGAVHELPVPQSNQGSALRLRVMSFWPIVSSEPDPEARATPCRHERSILCNLHMLCMYPVTEQCSAP